MKYTYNGNDTTQQFKRKSDVMDSLRYMRPSQRPAFLEEHPTDYPRAWWACMLAITLVATLIIASMDSVKLLSWLGVVWGVFK